MEKPVIGILSERTAPEGHTPRYEGSADYIEQIERAGGIPVQLPVTGQTGPEQLAAWVRLCGGVLLPGGSDLDPALYGRAHLPDIDIYGAPTAYERRAQDCELAFIRLAAEAGRPMLGICLGVQALNVAFGGTLVQDIPTQVPGALRHLQTPAPRGAVTHTVDLVPGTLAARLSGLSEGGSLSVNSFHHQAVETPAPGFAVAGRAPDGVIEAIEAPERRILGTQWHPENLAAERPEAFALFCWLVREAAR